MREEELSGVLRQVAGALNASMGNIYNALTRLCASKDRDADPKADMYAAILSRSYYTVLRLANNLETAGAWGGEESLSLENVDLVGLCRGVTDLCRAPAELAGRTLAFRCGDRRCVTAADAEQLRRLLLNLISNALKFTSPGGHISVECRAEKRRFLLTVTDDGPGVPEELLDTLFDRYLHAGRLDPPPHGLGLGLPICRRIAEAHGGSLMVVSPPEGGVEAIVSLPVRRLREDTLNLSSGDAVRSDRSGGYNEVLRELADALPREAFAARYTDS